MRVYLEPPFAGSCYDRTGQQAFLQCSYCPFPNITVKTSDQRHILSRAKRLVRSTRLSHIRCQFLYCSYRSMILYYRTVYVQHSTYRGRDIIRRFLRFETPDVACKISIGGPVARVKIYFLMQTFGKQTTRTSKTWHR